MSLFSPISVVLEFSYTVTRIKPLDFMEPPRKKFIHSDLEKLNWMLFPQTTSMRGNSFIYPTKKKKKQKHTIQGKLTNVLKM